ncbi:ATP-binding cassette-type vacuolar membrane transporter Hmt1 [Knufia obscura]|nr:ATP-binding cassette-type vacuolar membrane transporter Hmt1 [Knufia obscura]
MQGPGGRPLPTRRKSNNQIKEAVSTKDFSPRAKTAFAILTSGVILTFVLNGVATLIQVITYRSVDWWPGQSAILFIVGSFFCWGIVFISVIDTTPSPTWVHILTWSFALPFELVILGSALDIYTQPHNEPTVGDQLGGELRNDITAWEVFEVIVYFIRVIIILGLIILYTALKIAARKTRDTSSTPDETTQPLLGGTDASPRSNGHANGHTYGATHGSTPHSKEQPDAWAKPTETPIVTWYAYLKGFAVLLPYLWPRKSLKLQALALSCFCLMAAQRAINLLVPIYSGKITDALSGEDGNGIRAPWIIITLYILFRWLQGGQGILGAARSILWVPVEQYSYRAISTAAFEHVHSLSAEFHTGKRTGELISALNKGSAINSFLEMVTFNVGPMIFDLVVAIVYLTYKFDIYLALVVAIVTFLYIYVTIRLAAWRVTLRRNYTTADREMEAVKNDSLHSWDTVKYFNAEAYEFDRYRDSIKTMQGFEFFVEITLALMNTVQGTLFMVALLSVSFIEAFQVAKGYQSVGNFVTLLIYMAQLQAPLNFFGTFYRAIQNNLINAERMLELFKEQPNVTDKPTATDLQDCQGDIVFDHVNFSYDKRQPALKDFSFHCAPGTTTALVGESGGGKTTVMRLLFRYYNPTTGQIRIDNHDVSDITIDSLRRNIGVVPQDCNMFNESILYNLRYANQNATDEQIYSACRAASIHDRILQFADGYETKVGERGVKLSGGERQRVAIARTILKDPKITLLDEATAALDTETEEKIQDALRTLAKGRTMLIIAHRLSTIVEADQILVLSGGTVVERGTHSDLIELNGKYARMWRKQSRAQKAAVEADMLRKQAQRTEEAAGIDSASVSEEEMERVKGKRGGSGSGKGHKRVNFSQSSLGRTPAWNMSIDGGRPEGHP